jgi:phenylacetate-CoA ligase
MKINLQKLKTFYKSLPDELTYPLLYIPFGLFCGKSYRQDFSALQDSITLSNEQIELIRNQKLITYVNDSIKHTKFYADTAKKLKIEQIVNVEQLLEFPLISKEHIQNELDLFLDERYKNKRYKVTTGGTTGKQTALFLSNDCYGKEWAFVNSYLLANNVNVNAKRLCLRGVSGIKPSELLGYNFLYKELLISPFRLNSESVINSLSKIKKFQPKFIHGYPSSVKELSAILESNEETIDSIDTILLVSERIYPEQLIQIKKAFNANILSFYGMTERVIFAPLVDDVYIPNQLYGITEEVNGELIGTGFSNSATRLIRYRTGDTATVTKSGNFVSKIDELTGRWGKEYLHGKTGVNITMTSLNTHCNALERVNKYQFYQTSIGTCELRLIVNSDFTNLDFKNVIDAFQYKVGNELDINCKIVNDIPLTSRGKHQFIVVKLKNKD